MSPWRARWRQRLFRRSFPAIVGENPLEMAMIIWAFFAGLGAVVGRPKSNALETLPNYAGDVWAVIMVIAGLTVAVALVKRADAIISAGMYLFAAALSAYAVAILGASGYQRGGTAAALLFILGGVCFLRGWWLKEDDAVLIRQVVRSRRKEPH